MARWKLACTHYLNVTRPTKWRHTETDQSTGETHEKEYIVPRLLDITDPRCWTNRWGNKDNPEGEIVVCQPGRGEKGDLEFLGDPTPDMIPLDEEAQEISDSFQSLWAYKPDGTDNDFGRAVVDRSGSVPAAPVEVAGMADLVAGLTMMIQQQGELIGALTANRPGIGLKLGA